MLQPSYPPHKPIITHMVTYKDNRQGVSSAFRPIIRSQVKEYLSWHDGEKGGDNAMIFLWTRQFSLVIIDRTVNHIVVRACPYLT